MVDDMERSVLTQLSSEILHHVFCFVEATDLSSLARTCHYIRNYVARDDLLWKRIYLTHFDEPRNSPESWTNALQNLVKTDKLLNSQDYELKRTRWDFLARQVLPLLLASNEPRSTVNTSFLASKFNHAYRKSNASTLLRQSSLFRRCGMPDDLPADSIALRQLSARLHVYSALSLELRDSEFIDTPGAQHLHPYARSRLYDLRRYKRSNFWGPFMDDGSGRIDWEKVQAIYVVLGYGLRQLSERTGGTISGGVCWGMGLNGGSDEEMWRGLAPGSYRSMTLSEQKRKDEDTRSNAATAGSTIDGSDEDDNGVPPLDWFYDQYNEQKEAEFQHQQAVFATQDPYGVKGTWMRIVNFLDYHDLFAFNFQNQIPDHIERDGITIAEAFRLILLKLWVTKIEWPDEEEDEEQPEDWETVAGSSASSPAEQRNNDTESATNGNVFEQSDAEPQESSTVSEARATPASEKPKKKSKYPIVHFAGRSRSLHIRWDPNANSHIRGSNPFYHVIGQVRAYPAPPTPKSELQPDPSSTPSLNLSHIFLNPDISPSMPSAPSLPGCGSSNDEKVPTSQITGLAPEEDLVIRWTTWSVFNGEERWRSEGVQIGGLKSARGILGNWFDKDFDPHGPAGPTGFWKLGDGVELRNEKGRGTGLRVWGDDSD